MYTCKSITLDSELDWESLMQSSHTATFFQQRQWLRMWVTHFPIPYQILAVSNDSQLVAIAPISHHQGKIYLMGTSPVLEKEQVCDFGDIICLPGQEKEVWLAIVEYVSREFPREPFVPTFIREDSPSYAALLSLNSNSIVSTTSPYLNVPASWDEYLTGLKRKDRHELKRKLRKLESFDYRAYQANPDSINLQKCIALMKQSSPEKLAFLSQPMEQYFVDLMSTIDKTQVILWFMDVEDKTVACAIAFQFKNAMLLYNSGMDLSYGYLSVGLLSKALLIKHSIELGLTRFDFLQGDERYKYDLGGIDNRLYQFTFAL